MAVLCKFGKQHSVAPISRRRRNRFHFVVLRLGCRSRKLLRQRPAIMSSRVSATLVVVAVVISLIGAAHAQGAQSFASCGGRNFCQRWMCRQKNNRLCNIVLAVVPGLDPANCASVNDANNPFNAAFVQAKNQCDAAMSATPASLLDSCTVTTSSSSNVLVTPGMLYDETTCTNPNPDDDTYVPPQLRKTDGPQEHKETVYVEDRALNRTYKRQYDDAAKAIGDNNQTCIVVNGNLVPSNPTYRNFSCICNTPATDKTCQDQIVNDLYRVDQAFKNQYAQVFVEEATPLYVSMGAVVNGQVVTNETAPTIAPSNQQLSGSNGFFGGNPIFTPPPFSPAPPPPVPSPVPARRRLRERKLANRLIQVPRTGAQVAQLG